MKRFSELLIRFIEPLFESNKDRLEKKLLEIGVDQGLAEQIAEACERYATDFKQLSIIMLQVFHKGFADREDLLSIVYHAPGLVTVPSDVCKNQWMDAGELVTHLYLPGEYSDENGASPL